MSEAHESLAASLERYREKVPWVRTKAPPTCESQGGGCSCSAWCWARGSKEEAAAGPGPPSRRCAVCGVEKEACGGLPAAAADFDAAQFYGAVHGTNCENVVGFLTIPVGVVGPPPPGGDRKQPQWDPSQNRQKQPLPKTKTIQQQ